MLSSGRRTLCVTACKKTYGPKRMTGRVVTRFPPEPNGYLHIGHTKSICLNFGIAEEFSGRCNLRFDDTNPSKEDVEYVESIREDIRWLGFEWGDGEHFASDYFDRLYDYAVELIQQGNAYVDSLSGEEMRAYRGNFHTPGKDSPYRSRPIAENLDLFTRMRAGEFADGEHVLRAKIDMQSGNLNLRDPTMYRIQHATHHRTGQKWCIYPMYDWAHGLSDAIEGVTHSICTLEFEAHRPLYDWFLQQLKLPYGKPEQIEFGRLNLSYTVLSKRKLLKLVEEKHVDGWDDPRMPTVSGLRRRGVTATAIRRFCDRIGVSKRDGVVDVSLFEHAVREHLNETSPRTMAVLDPLKLTITNFPADETRMIEAPYHPDEPSWGSRSVPFSAELWVERDDFRESAPKKWYRLAPGREVRLRYACYVTVQDVVRGPSGEIVELRCTWDPESWGGSTPDKRRVRGTIHWVSAAQAASAEVRCYDRLFSVKNPQEHEDFVKTLNPEALVRMSDCKVEPSLAGAEAGSRIQFERKGYFCVDRDSSPNRLVFNRTITLRDSWAKLEKKLAAQT